MKIAFVGTHDIVFPFKSLGADIICIEGKNIEEVKKEIEKKSYAIVYVFEGIFKELERFKELIERPDINIVPIPGIKGSKEYGKKRISDIIKKAVGMELGGFE